MFDQFLPHTRCEMILISRDTAIEPVEIFSVRLQTADPRVNILVDTAVVQIIDSSRVELRLEKPSYNVTENVVLVVCALLEGGSLQRNVLAQVSTQAVTATSEC